MQQQKMQMSKKQFRIGDLAEELKVKKFVIRFWEKEFDLKSDRSGGGQRFYTVDDLKRFLLIKDLLYNQGFTIAGAKKQLSESLLRPGGFEGQAGVEEQAPNQEISSTQASPEQCPVIEVPEESCEQVTPATLLPCDCNSMAEKLGPLKEQLAQLKQLLERSLNR